MIFSSPAFGGTGCFWSITVGKQLLFNPYSLRLGTSDCFPVGSLPGNKGQETIGFLSRP